MLRLYRHIFGLMISCMEILSVRPSVRLTRSGVASKRLTVDPSS